MGGAQKTRRRLTPRYPMYVAHYKEWRTFVAPYYDYAQMEAKTSIDAIFGGGRCPPGDAPFLHALRVELNKGDVSLLTQGARESSPSLRTHGEAVIWAPLSLR